MRIRLFPNEIAKLKDEQAVAKQLHPRALQILGRARSRAPHWLNATFTTRYGVGPRGAYAQARAIGSGAVLAEYGGARSPAHAYMRGAI